MPSELEFLSEHRLVDFNKNEDNLECDHMFSQDGCQWLYQKRDIFEDAMYPEPRLEQTMFNQSQQEVLTQSYKHVPSDFNLDNLLTAFIDDESKSLPNLEDADITSRKMTDQTDSDAEQQSKNCSENNSEEEQEAPKKDRKKPPKQTFIESCSKSVIKELSDMCINELTKLKFGQNANYRLCDQLEEYLRVIYQENKFLDPDLIHCKPMRLILKQIYSVVLGTQRKERPNIVFLDPRRHDQYIKKAFSKMKTKLYKDFKKETTKIDAHVRMKNDLNIEQQAFDQIFGPKSSNGLAKQAIEFILGFYRKEGETDNRLFNSLFSTQNTEELLKSMEESTRDDIKTKFINKIEKLLHEGKFSPSTLNKTISASREFKTPFSSQENLMALDLLVKKFLKYCKKNRSSGHLKEMIANQTRRLEELSRSLEDRLFKNKWTLKYAAKKEFKKSEIPSFLIRDLLSDK